MNNDTRNKLTAAVTRPGDLKALAEIVAAEPEQLWIVRLWDGFDNEWMDVSDPMPEADARKLAGDKNEAHCGKRDAGYGDIDYYAAFEADTTMVFSAKGKREVFGVEDTK